MPSLLTSMWYSPHRYRSVRWLMLMLLLTATMVALVSAATTQPVFRDSDDESDDDTSPLYGTTWKARHNWKPTDGDFHKLIAAEGGVQIVDASDGRPLPAELPSLQLADILPATGFVLVKDYFTGNVFLNATGFFVAPNVVITAAHAIARAMQEFHVRVEFVTNSRTVSGSKTYAVTAIAYDQDNTPCQILLQTNGNHTNFLPLSRTQAEDGSMVRVLSNSPIGFGGIHLDGLVSRVFDVWEQTSQHQCLRDQSIAKWNWYCDQSKFLISTPTWEGASGSPVIASTGVIGTVESYGPHTGTAVAASTHGIVIPPLHNFTSIDLIHPRAPFLGAPGDTYSPIVVYAHLHWRYFVVAICIAGVVLLLARLKPWSMSSRTFC